MSCSCASFGRQGSPAKTGSRRRPAPVPTSRFPLFTDENIDGPIIRGLRKPGWEALDAFDDLAAKDDVLVFPIACLKLPG